jgi:hypothetical protein
MFLNRSAAVTAITATALGMSGISSATQLSLPSFNSSGDLANPSVVDLSRLVKWNGSVGTSMFQIGTDPVTGETALSIAPAALGEGSTQALYGWTALDLRLPAPVVHTNNTMTINFTVRWNSLFDSSGGERNRLMVDLLDNYPSGQPPLSGNAITPDNPAFAGVYPYGQPTYHLRLRPGSSNDPNFGDQSFLEYGGAKTVNGVNYENTSEWGSDGTAANNTIWNPGFIAAVNTNGSEASPAASLPNFPATSQVTMPPIFAGEPDAFGTSTLTRFKYIITPTEQDCYEELSGANSFSLLGSMPTPQTSTAPAYTYYQSFDAIRIYFNNSTGKTVNGIYEDSNTYLSNFSVDVSAVPEPATLSLLSLAVCGFSRRRKNRFASRSDTH